MKKTKNQFIAIFSLLQLQANNWQSTIRYELRFLLCGFFMYLSFSILKPLGELLVGKENELLVLIFDNPPFLVMMLFVLSLGYLGLYLPIIAAALFSSLLPKT